MRQKTNSFYSCESYDFSNVSEDAKLYYRLSLDPSVQRAYQSLNEYYCRHLKLQSGLQRLLEGCRRQKDVLLQSLSETSVPAARGRLEKQVAQLSARIADLETCYLLETSDIRTFQEEIGL